MANCWQIFIESLAAISTALAVVVALFSTRIQRFLVSPRLKVKANHFEILPMDRQGRAMVYLCVQNTGNARANDAEVLVERVEKFDRNRGFRPQPQFIPMSLRWAHLENPVELFVSINPDMHRYITLGALHKCSDSKEVRCFELWTEYAREEQANKLQAGTYKISLILGSQEGLTEKIFLELVVPQTFNESELRISRYTER